MLNGREVDPAELLRSIERLEDFAHMACHDLRAPLRAMMSLIDWVREDLQETYGDLPASIADDLGELSRQGERMSRFISDLLAFALVGRAQEGPRHCRAAEEAEEAVRFCAIPKGFTVTIKPGLPDLAVDPVEFSMVLRNLLTNAVVHHDRSGGRIEIDHRIEGARCNVIVRDDGPGVAEKDGTLIFEVFRSVGLTRGHGIGLGVVRKIALLYGAEPRVQTPASGRGAEFIVGFPCAAPQSSPAATAPLPRV